MLTCLQILLFTCLFIYCSDYYCSKFLKALVVSDVCKLHSYCYEVTFLYIVLPIKIGVSYILIVVPIHISASCL